MPRSDDPFVYFDDITGWDGTSYHTSARCTNHVVDYTLLATDLANDATPNLDDDMHASAVSADAGTH
jgi:hypothetical protein